MLFIGLTRNNDDSMERSTSIYNNYIFSNYHRAFFIYAKYQLFTN